MRREPNLLFRRPEAAISHADIGSPPLQPASRHAARCGVLGSTLHCAWPTQRDTGPRLEVIAAPATLERPAALEQLVSRSLEQDIQAEPSPQPRLRWLPNLVASAA